jgi:TatD DNase family protein
MLVDSHCHLNYAPLNDSLEEAIASAEKDGLLRLQTICTKMSEFADILKLAESYEKVFCSVGNHPLNVKEEGIAEVADIVAKTKHSKVIGIGETGLDYYYDEENKEQQKISFINHIKAAQETQLPLIVHTRDADEDTVAILKEQYAQKSFKAVIHCFTASHWLAEECLEMGMYISASGIVTFKNAKDIQETFRTIPLDRILLETDAPFLAPAPHRGKTNQPAYVKHVAEFISQLREQPYEEICEVTTQNFFDLFSKAK